MTRSPDGPMIKRGTQNMKRPAVVCSACATDLTGFSAYDDPPSGLLCWICAKIISDLRAGALDLNDDKARLRYSPGRFDLVRSYLRMRQEKVAESYENQEISNYLATTEVDDLPGIVTQSH